MKKKMKSIDSPTIVYYHLLDRILFSALGSFGLATLVEG